MSRNERDIAWDLIAKSRFFDNEKHMLTELYANASIPEVAAVLNTSTGTIIKRMERNNIPRRPRGGIVSKSSVKYKMFHVDQRIILILGLTDCANSIGVSTASLYKYKQWKIGRMFEMQGHVLKENTNDAILCDQPSDGTPEVGNEV